LERVFGSVFALGEPFDMVIGPLKQHSQTGTFYQSTMIRHFAVSMEMERSIAGVNLMKNGSGQFRENAITSGIVGYSLLSLRKSSQSGYLCGERGGGFFGTARIDLTWPSEAERQLTAKT